MSNQKFQWIEILNDLPIFWPEVYLFCELMVFVQAGYFMGIIDALSSPLFYHLLTSGNDINYFCSHQKLMICR